MLASGNCSGLRVLRNRFLCASGGQITSTSSRHLVGLWMTPDALDTTTTQGSGTSQTASATTAPTKSLYAKQTGRLVKTKLPASGLVNLPLVTHCLDDIEIIDNRFTGLSMAVLVMAELGMVRCIGNRVANGCGGFWFLDSDLGANIAFGQAALAREQQTAGEDPADAATVRQWMQPVFLANALNFSSAIKSPSAPSSTPANAAVSDETRAVLAADYTAQGVAAYTSFAQSASASGSASTATGAQPGANLKPTLSTRSKKSPASKTAASAPPSVAAAPVKAADYTNASAAYTALVNVGLARELAGTTLIPALYIRDNDVELIPYDTTADNPASLQGIRCMLNLKTTSSGALFLSGNRIEVPNGYSIAVTSEWAASTVIAGNFFNQLGVEFKAVRPCAVLITGERALFAITGNVVNADWRVSPARFDIPAATDWKFLNTVL